MPTFKSFSHRLNYYKRMELRVRLLRSYVKWNQRWERMKKFFNPHKPELDDSQEKVIEFFRMLIKNREAILNHSVKAKIRYIETDFALVTLTGTSNDYMLRIIEDMDSKKPNSNEIPIPREHALEIIEEFDLEMERRFRALENTIKKIVINDINKLINKVKIGNN